MTLEELSNQTGLSLSYLSQLERGERGQDGIPSPEILEKLAEPLGTSYMELMVAARYVKHKSLLDQLKLEENILQMKIEGISNDISTKKSHFKLKNKVNDAELIRVIQNEISLLEEMEEKVSLELQSTIDKVQYYEKKHESNENLYVAESMDSQQDTGNGYLTRLRQQKIYFDVPRIDSDDKHETNRIISRVESKKRFLSLEYLLTMDEDIYINERVLSLEEKERALKVLKLVFEGNETD